MYLKVNYKKIKNYIVGGVVGCKIVHKLLQEEARWVASLARGARLVFLIYLWRC